MCGPIGFDPDRNDHQNWEPPWRDSDMRRGDTESPREKESDGEMNVERGREREREDMENGQSS